MRLQNGETFLREICTSSLKVCLSSEKSNEMFKPSSRMDLPTRWKWMEPRGTAEPLTMCWVIDRATWHLLKSWPLLVVDEIDCGWNPPADLNGMPAVCWVWPVAGEKLPSFTKPVCAAVPVCGVRAICCCCWKFPCGGNCWLGCPGGVLS